jgi:alpha(1,3/1,4) fucosyltransferase
VKVYIIILSVFLLNVHAERVDVVSSFNLSELVPRRAMINETGYRVRYFRCDFDVYYENFYRDDIDRVVVMADIKDGTNLAKVPKDKKVLMLWEAPGSYHDLENSVSRILTFNDDSVNNKNYFKFHYPVLVPMIKNVPNFDKKKFCVLMTHRRTDERVKMIRFFETKPSNEFEYYGFNSIVQTNTYKGQIPGHPLSNDKMDILKKFKFALAFENHEVNGYITEKIFTCFTAGVVPVYFGAPNISNYIPDNCYINYYDFATPEELYNHMKSITKDQYNEYIANIRKFLKSEQAKKYSMHYFSKTIGNCVKNIID